MRGRMGKLFFGVHQEKPGLHNGQTLPLQVLRSRLIYPTKQMEMACLHRSTRIETRSNTPHQHASRFSKKQHILGTVEKLWKERECVLMLIQ